jgi:hypothetical protein
MHQRPLFAAAAVSLLASLASAPARADDPATAQALFTDAKKLMAAGKYSDACPKLEESDHASPAIGTKFNLADCYEHTGRTASAWAGFLSVAAAAKNANQGAREKAARDRAKALEPKLSRISIVVQTPVDGLEVKRDEESIGSAQWGEALPVDPGEHTLSAKATGKRPWKTIVDVATGPSTVKVIIPTLDDDPNPPAAAAAASTGGASTPASSSPASQPGGSSASPVGWVLLGVGAVAAIGGGVFWVLRSSDASQLQADCGPSGNDCNKPGDAADISNGKTYDVIAITLFAVGGAAILGGGALLLAGGGHHSAATASLVPVAEPGGGGLVLRGSF